MIGASKGFDTIVAFEWPVASVFPLVASQLVRSGEPRITVWNVAQIWFLSGMNPFVGLQVTTLGVNFLTTRILAIMNSSFLQFGIIMTIASDLGCCCCCC